MGFRFRTVLAAVARGDCRLALDEVVRDVCTKHKGVAQAGSCLSVSARRYVPLGLRLFGGVHFRGFRIEFLN